MPPDEKQRGYRPTPGPAGHNDAADVDRALAYPVENPGITGVNDTPEGDQRVADPSIVVCTVLCYLGIPPALWKSVIELFLRAVAEQYRAAYGVARAEKEFRAWKTKFLGYSMLKTLRLIIEFSANGTLVYVPVTKLGPKVRILRKRLQVFLIKKGAKLATQVFVLQVLRKVILITELVFAGACLGYCTAEAAARKIIEMTKVVAAGTAEAMKVIEGIGKFAQDVGVAVFIRPMLIARASLDQSNWVLHGLPTRLRVDLNATFGLLWLTKVQHLKGNDFLAFAATSMAAAGIPKELLRDLASGLANASPPRRGLVDLFVPPEVLQAEDRKHRSSTIDRLESMMVYEFVQYLAEKGFLRFKTSPEAIADRQLGHK